MPLAEAREAAQAEPRPAWAALRAAARVAARECPAAPREPAPVREPPARREPPAALPEPQEVQAAAQERQQRAEPPEQEPAAHPARPGRRSRSWPSSIPKTTARSVTVSPTI